MEQYIDKLNNQIKEALKEAKANVEEAENKYYNLVKEKIEYETIIAKYEKKLKDIKAINKKSLLNRWEEKVFNMIYTKLNKDRFILWCQVSLSAILKNKEQKDWHKYNKFYVDFLIVEKESKKPYLIIEYDGQEAHGKAKTIAKDRFRDAICAKAGLEVVRLKQMNIDIKDKQDIDKMEKTDQEKYQKYLKEHLQNYETYLKESLLPYKIIKQ